MISLHLISQLVLYIVGIFALCGFLVCCSCVVRYACAQFSLVILGLGLAGVYFILFGLNIVSYSSKLEEKMGFFFFFWEDKTTVFITKESQGKKKLQE